MLETELHHLSCPYCGESIELVIDCSEGEQCYIEDCEVCCRPIALTVSVNEEGQVDVRAQHENE